METFNGQHYVKEYHPLLTAQYYLQRITHTVAFATKDPALYGLGIIQDVHRHTETTLLPDHDTNCKSTRLSYSKVYNATYKDKAQLTIEPSRYG